MSRIQKVNVKSSIKIIICCFVLLIAMLYMKYENTVFSGIEGQKRFGSTYMTMNNPFFEVINTEIKKVVEAKGDILITLDPVLDIEKQKEQIHSFITQKVDAIFINPIDWQKIEPALQVAKQANIPIIVVDAPVDNKNLVDCTIVSDNYDAGVQCAMDMMEKKEAANIVLLEHSAAKSAKDRMDGFLDTIASFPQYQVVYREECEGQLEKAMPIMENIMHTVANIDVVMTLNDPSALGALAALEAAGITDDVLVYGVDGSPEIKSLLKHTTLIQATAAQSPIKIGQMAVTQAYLLLEGKFVEKEIVVPVTLIKKENVDSYTGGWQ